MTNPFAEICFFHAGTREEKLDLLAQAFAADLPKLGRFQTFFNNLRGVRRADEWHLRLYERVRADDVTIQDLLKDASPHLAEKFALEALNESQFRLHKQGAFVASLQEGAQELLSAHSLMRAAAEQSDQIQLTRAARLLKREEERVASALATYGAAARENTAMRALLDADAPERTGPSPF